jgi:tetratricopeptide (TPR) repeat protein
VTLRQENNMNTVSHYWLRGGRKADRQAAALALELPAELVPTVDAHCRLRGPYTAAGTIVRALVPEVLERLPDLVRSHDIELLSVAPELNTAVPGSRETLTSMAIPKERTRFYARLRTRRIANGLVEFIRDSLPAGERRTLVVENVEHAEATDVEFLAALLRRIDPGRLTVVLCTGDTGILDPQLQGVVDAHARMRSVIGALGEAAADAAGWADPDEVVDLAWQHVRTECSHDDPRLFRAYEAIDARTRARLHDRRALELMALEEQSLKLGAIPYHLERGTDPHHAGARALYDASDHCLVMGFYSAVVDYGYRGIELVDWREDEDFWWMFVIELGLALSILSRTAEAEALYDKARLVSTNPTVHMAAAYSTAMLYTRHNDPEDRNDQTAKAWLNSAIATASLLDDKSERAFQSAFYKNGLALVEVNLGQPSEALRLVDECIASLDRELTPDEHRLHRSVLKNNRARVYLMLGRLDDALADYEVVIAADPNHAEHYLERGNIMRRLGRPDDALADYQRAIALSPPFPEIYYNRADLRMVLGDVEGAMTDFSYTLELDPEFVDAYVNRAGLHLDSGNFDAACADAEAGLVLEGDNPYLHAVVAQVHAARGEPAAARAAFDRALAADPDLVSALSGRAALEFDAGEFAAAVADLDRAVEGDAGDPGLRYNRALTYQEVGRWQDAYADLQAAARLDGNDPDIIVALERCRLHLKRGEDSAA